MKIRKAGSATNGSIKPNTPGESEQVSTPSMSSLSDQKLTLEIAKLKFESGWGRWLEAFKAAVPVLGSIGIVGTLALGIRQFSLAQRARDDERFERSVTRLSSQRVSERLTGLAGLQQFIQSDDSERQRSTLTFLLNAAVVEENGTVRKAILDVFDGAEIEKVKLAALNATLITARDRNRTALSDWTNDFIAREHVAGKQLPDPRFTDSLVDDPDRDKRTPVETTGKMIASLIRAGAHISDLSGVYCGQCIFSSREHPVKLSNVNFSSAYLRRADFTGASLRSANFNNADLTLATFMSADLSQAKITADEPIVPPVQSTIESNANMSAAWGTNFACATLRGADFSGRIVFSLIYDNPVYGGNFHDEFYASDLADAQLSKARLVVAVPEGALPPTYINFLQVPDAYLPFLGGTANQASPPVKYFDGLRYVMFIFSFSENFTIKTLPNPFYRDLTLNMSSWMAAKNLAESQIPPSVEKFIALNKGFFDKPVISYDCQSGQKRADVSNFMNDPGPKSTRF